VRPLAVHHVSLNVPDVGAGIDFYVRILGGTLRKDRPDLGFDGAWIDIGAQQVHLLRGAVPTDTGQHFAIQVDDLRSVIAELRSSGVEVSDATPIGSGHQAFLHDPANNLVELHEVGA